MRKTLSLFVLAPLALAACNPPVPDSGAYGSNYDAYRMQREAALTGAPVMTPGAQIASGPVTAAPLAAGAPAMAGGFSTERIGAAIDSAAVGGAGQVVAGVPAYGVTAGVPTPPVTSFADDVALQSAGVAPVISAPSVPVIAAPTAAQNLPTRAGNGPNLVQYALTTSHPAGTTLYERSSLQLRDPTRACQAYSSADQAQAAFLDAGGPQKDRKGLDPDGDGYVCGWDPAPFRKVLQ